jgi:glycosyltransferase involved in cell wall biosynthesis
VRHYFEGEVTINCDRIILISGYLSDEDLATLYRMSNFYLCGSVAEGQNLPLLEAMSYGVVPVSTAHTAMADYLTEDNSVAIRSRPFAAYRREMAADVTARPYAVGFASQTDIGRALLRACALPQARLRQMRHNARQTIARRFAPAVVAGMIRDRLAAITGGGHDQ